MQEDAAGPAAEQTPEQTPLAGARLDELLGEVLTRVTGVLDAQERLRGLLDAVVGINADLSLERALERIVTAACTLADARVRRARRARRRSRSAAARVRDRTG